MLDPLDPRWQDIPVAAPALTPSTDGACAFATTPLGQVELAALGRGAFRLRIGKVAAPDYGILVDEPEAVGSAEAGPAAIAVSEGRDRLSFDLATGAITLLRNGMVVVQSATDGHFVRPRRLPTLGRADQGWVASFALSSGERVYGLGEKWGPLDKRGLLVDCWTEDALGVNAEKAYKNAPFGWTTEGWGLFVHTPARVRNGVGYPHWSHRSWVVEVEDEALDLFLFLGSGQEIIARYTELTGRMAPPPLWSLGAWISRAYYRTPTDAIEAAKGMRERAMPAEVILIDGRAWQDTDTRFTFDWDRTRWPDPKAEIDTLHALGFKVVCWEYPLVSVRNPVFGELDRKGFFLKDGRTGKTLLYQWDMEPFGKVLTPLPESAILDFTNEEAARWWRERHALAFDVGVDAMKPDFGEQVPDHAIAHNGDSGRRLHNVYPLLYNRAAWEASVAARGSDALLFTRAAWAGSQRYPMQWGGDPQSDWEGMAASLRGGLSWGLTGAPAHATDIGGFYGAQPDAELFLRWTAMAVFQSHMRFHGIGPREPYAFGPEAEAVARAWLQLRYRLLPYIAGTVEVACRTGLPCQRAMALAFPEDVASWGFEEQFMFGPDLLVAPVLSPGGRVRLRVPDGQWRDFWTGVAVPGNRTIDAVLPLDRIALLVREGAQIPLGPVVAHTGELAGRNRVEELLQFGAPSHPPTLPDGWSASEARAVRMDRGDTTRPGGD